MLAGVLLLCVLAAAERRDKTSAASRDICRSRCACEEREGLLNVNCESKGFTSVSHLHAPPNRMAQLFLNGNFLSRLAANEFANYGNVTSLHLGNNGLQEIRAGAFNGLRALKRLHLNNNNLEAIREDTLAGLESLEYLQADYNYISAVEPGAFSGLPRLKVLILNDNLLPALPANVFRFLLLTHLDLRGNRLKTLPFAGVLEHIGGIVEIQLEENPWNCTCDLVPLKTWLDTVSVFVGDIVCETPFRLHGKDVTQLIRQDLCPRRNGPPSDFQGVRPPTHPPGVVTATRAPKASRPPKTRQRPTPHLTSRDKHVFGPIMVYQTRSPAPTLCPGVCVCTAQSPDSGLNVNCQERKLHNMSELVPRPSHPKKLHLTGNYLQAVYHADLAEYGSLELLHLGNNRISTIQEGAFQGLASLRRLYLNGNYIEALSPALFSGLQSLQYLYLEYNVIKRILPRSFSQLHNLQLLFLNNNLLRALPDGVFAGTMLTRLNLRSNHFSHLPVRGVLDQLSAFIQIDLQENPWACTCGLVALKDWMELSSTSVVVNEITCDSPSKHAGRLLRSLRNDAICPTPPSPSPSPAPSPSSASSTGIPTIASPATEPSTPIPTPATSAGFAQPRPPGLHPEVPLSVLILGLLVVFILSVCLGAGLFVFVLRRRKGAEHAAAGAGSLDMGAFQIQYGAYAAERVPDKSAESHVYNYIPPPVGAMCQNPIYTQKECEPAVYYRELKELALGALESREGDVLTRSPGTYTVSTLDSTDTATVRAQGELLYQNVAERPGKPLPTYGLCTLPRRPCAAPPYDAHGSVRRAPRTAALYGSAPGRYHGAEPQGSSVEHPLLLPGKLRTEPDYLEVLEKQTAMSQL